MGDGHIGVAIDATQPANSFLIESHWGDTNGDLAAILYDSIFAHLNEFSSFF